MTLKWRSLVPVRSHLVAHIDTKNLPPREGDTAYQYIECIPTNDLHESGYQGIMVLGLIKPGEPKVAEIAHGFCDVIEWMNPKDITVKMDVDRTGLLRFWGPNACFFFHYPHYLSDCTITVLDKSNYQW